MRLIIIGAGGFGREVLAWALDCQRAAEVGGGNPFEIGGFIDSNPSVLERFGVDVPILGSIEDYVPHEDDRFVIAIGSPAIRMRIAQRLEERGWIFTTLIHPTAIVGPRVIIGHGSILCPYAVVTTDVVIGNHVILNVHATVGHDAKVGAGCTINGLCEITGRCELGEGVSMGTHASLIPGRKVGNYAVIGAGSTVIRNVPELATVFGVPATKLRDAD